MCSDRIKSVIGLGHVGLPVAVAFGKVRRTVGFSINKTRSAELRDGYGPTGEVTSKDLLAADLLRADNIGDLMCAVFHIVAVPTPIDWANQPDLRLMCRPRKRPVLLSRWATSSFTSPPSTMG